MLVYFGFFVKVFRLRRIRQSGVAVYGLWEATVWINYQFERKNGR
jgi:hypothetical protein